MSRRRTTGWLSAAMLIGSLMALLAGCGGSGGSESADSGEVLIGLTDAEGDFLRYAVKVDSIALTGADGRVVETLPAGDAVVDFAELTELTEFFTAATVPAGVYTGVKLTLDYNGADIQVEVNGEAKTAVALDGAGRPLSIVEIPVRLGESRRLVVAPGIPALLTLDFDLPATNTVDTGADPPRVTVEPLLIAEVNPERPKAHRVRGPLAAVNEAASTFTLGLHPRGVAREFGRLQVRTSAETVFEVDGQSAAGAAGLALLAAKGPGTAVVAVGQPDPANHVLLAREVTAGSSVPGGTLDGLTGVVAARQGDLLTVRGATLDRSAGVLYLRREVTVSLEGASVSRQGDPGGAFGTGDISVGQRIAALGSYDPESATLAADHVRLLLTSVAGTAVDIGSGAEGGGLTLSLQRLAGRDAASFNFAGTGTDSTHDADPASYQVGTGALSLASLKIGEPVRVTGFVTPFAAAPPDFTALSVIDLSALAAGLHVRWASGAAALTVDPARIAIDLGAAPALARLAQGWVALPLPADALLTLVPAQDGGLFAIRVAGTTALYTSFADFAAVLTGHLGGGAPLNCLAAEGSYDAGTLTLGTRRIVAGFGAFSMGPGR